MASNTPHTPHGLSESHRADDNAAKWEAAQQELDDLKGLFSLCTCADPACPAHGDSPETAVLDPEEFVL